MTAATAYLQRYYGKARRSAGVQANAATLTALEMDYWIVHRRLAVQRRTAPGHAGDVEPMVESLARLHAALFTAAPEAIRRSAELRAEAAVAVDRITGGYSTDVVAGWRQVERLLPEVYRSVQQTAQAERAGVLKSEHQMSSFRPGNRASIRRMISPSASNLDGNPATDRNLTNLPVTNLSYPKAHPVQQKGEQYTMNDNLAITGAIYEAFGKGDIPAILGYLSDDVRWEEWADNTAQQTGVPWLQAQHGKAGALAFFQVMGGLCVLDFRVLSLMAGGNQVAAEIEIAFESPATGRGLRDQEMHLWTFDDSGQVIRMRHYVDTAKHIATAQG